MQYYLHLPPNDNAILLSMKVIPVPHAEHPAMIQSLMFVSILHIFWCKWCHKNTIMGPI